MCTTFRSQTKTHVCIHEDFLFQQKPILTPFHDLTFIQLKMKWIYDWVGQNIWVCGFWKKFPSLMGWIESEWETCNTPLTSITWYEAVIIAVWLLFGRNLMNPMSQVQSWGKKTNKQKNSRKCWFQTQLRRSSLWSVHKGKWHVRKHKDFSFTFKF